MSRLQIESRFNRLERSVKIYRIILLSIASVIAVVAILSFNKKTTSQDVLQAKEFQVVDDYGTVYMSLKRDGDAGEFNLYNSKGTKLISLLSSDGGAGTIIGRDNYGKKTYRLINVKGGGGSLAIYNANETIADELTITDKNTGYLEVNNSEGNKMLLMTYGSGSSSGIFSVYNNSNNRICVLGSDANSNGVLNVYNSSGSNLNGVWPK
jgi:hypothetical protein